MNPTRMLHDLGQSLWLDDISRSMLREGVLHSCVENLSVTGVTSNPTIFDHAIRNTGIYDEAIAGLVGAGRSGESLFFELALEDIRQAADVLRPIHDRTRGIDGWVSLEVSPLLAHDTKATIASAKDLHARAARPNVMIKIPGTPQGLPAIEEAIFEGVPINVTLLFSDEQYRAAAEAYMRGIERRIEAGRSPDVGSVASLFISRWDVAVAKQVPADRQNQLGIAIAKRTYRAHRRMLASTRWLRAYNFGAWPQRLLWASTGTKDPNASDILYVRALAAPFTVNTLPEETLRAFSDHGEVGSLMPPDGGDGERTLTHFARAGIDVSALALKLQEEGAGSFTRSWNDLMEVIASKSSETHAAKQRQHDGARH